jgi:hypothetical protein
MILIAENENIREDHRAELVVQQISRFLASLAPWTGAPGSPKRTWVEQDGRPGFPAMWHSPTAACAAFSKESRMRFVNATNLHRKSGRSPSFFFSCK